MWTNKSTLWTNKPMWTNDSTLWTNDSTLWTNDSTMGTNMSTMWTNKSTLWNPRYCGEFHILWIRSPISNCTYCWHTFDFSKYGHFWYFPVSYCTKMAYREISAFSGVFQVYQAPEDIGILLTMWAMVLSLQTRNRTCRTPISGLPRVEETRFQGIPR